MEQPAPTDQNSKSRKPRLLFKFLAMLLPILLLGAVYEAVGQFWLFKKRLNYYSDVDHRMEPKPEKGINSDGLRCDLEATDIKDESLNVIILGDSFAFGWDLESNETIPFKFAEMARAEQPELSINAINFGWPSSSPILDLRLLKDVGAKYKPDYVLLLLDMSDIHDEIKYRHFIDKRGIYRAYDFIPVWVLTFRKIMERMNLQGTWHERIFGYPEKRYFHSHRPLDQSIEKFAPITESLDQLKSYCEEELGVPFICFILPRGYQYDARESPECWERDAYTPMGPHVREPLKYFDQLATERDYPIIGLLPAFEDCKEYPTCFVKDMHYNPTGARIAAQAIYEHCKQLGVFTTKD